MTLYLLPLEMLAYALLLVRFGGYSQDQAVESSLSAAKLYVLLHLTIKYW